MMIGRKVLVAADNTQAVASVRRRLEKDVYRVFAACSGPQALSLIRRRRPDVFVVDQSLPDVGGSDLDRVLRGETPIIILTADAMDEEMSCDTESEITCHVAKSAAPGRVLSHVRAALRTVGTAIPEGPEQTRCADIVIDRRCHDVRVRGETVDLTPTEFKLLEVLTREPGRAFTRLELLRRVFGYDYEGLERTVDTHVKNLRKKIEPDPKEPTCIETVYGVRYRFIEAGSVRGATADARSETSSGESENMSVRHKIRYAKGTRRMKKQKIWIIGITVLLLTTGGSYFTYTRTYGAQAQEPEEQTLETATVSQGNITLSASGSGELIPADELDLAFRASGLLQEILVETGEQVEEGDLLAQLETNSLEQALVEADTDLRIAELELTDVREGPSEVEIADAEARVRDAQIQLTLAFESYEDATDDSSDGAVEHAKTMYDWWVGYYQSHKAKHKEGKIDQTKHDYAMAAMIEAEEAWERAKNEAKITEVQALESLKQVRNSLLQAEADLELLQSQPLTDTLTEAELKVDEAALAFEEAQLNLEAAQLQAPFSGTVMDVAAEPGEQVGTGTTILTLANLQEPLLRFWLEESDMGGVAMGNQVNVVFDALPDTTFTGTVVRVDPVLVMVNGTPAVQAQASLFLDDRDATLLSGMTADVEVIAAEARDVLLVPVEALEKGPDGGNTVLVVTADGALEEREVEVGLMDALNAEVLSGLELGEMVRVGG